MPIVKPNGEHNWMCQCDECWLRDRTAGEPVAVECTPQFATILWEKEHGIVVADGVKPHAGAVPLIPQTVRCINRCICGAPCARIMHCETGTCMCMRKCVGTSAKRVQAAAAAVLEAERLLEERRAELRDAELDQEVIRKHGVAR